MEQDDLLLTPLERDKVGYVDKNWGVVLDIDALLQAQLAKAKPLLEKRERERIIGVIESYNSIHYPYGADFKEAILQALKEGKI